MRIGVLSVQGAFAEHTAKLRKYGADTFEIRQKSDISEPFDGLVLPGGESTVMRKLLHELGLYEPLKARIESGLPVLATCAGMILLARSVEGGEPCFGTMDITVKRNAYGRQLGSFRCTEDFDGKPVEMPFIRAPFVSDPGSAKVLAAHDNRIVAVKQGAQLACAFHPELTGDSTVYDMFLNDCKGE